MGIFIVGWKYDSRFLAEGAPEERTDIRLFLYDLKMNVVGEAADWAAVLVKAPVSQPDLLLVSWELISSGPDEALKDFKLACPSALVIVLTNHLDARQQVALSASDGVFISKNELPIFVTERLRITAASIPINQFELVELRMDKTSV